MSPNSLFMFVCLSSFFTTRCKRFTTCWNSKLLMWNRVQSSCVPQDTTFARFIWGAGLLKQRGSPPAAEMRCASAWHAWNERLPEKYAISCSGAACLCTLQNASRCMQYDLNNFKISRQNPSEVSWCCESMKASCTTTWSLFFSTSFYFSNLSNCNLFELHVHVPSARNRRQDWGGLARGDGSSCHISQCSDFAFLWGSAKVNVWTSIDFHSGNKSPEMSFLVSWFKFRFVRASAESCNAWNASLVRPVPKTVATRRSEALGDSQHGKGHVFWMELYLTLLIATLRLQDCNYIDRFRWH